MLKLLVLVLPLGLDLVRVAAALCASENLTGRARVRVSVLFVLFEAGMPLVGLAVGAPLAHAVGDVADYRPPPRSSVSARGCLLHDDSDDEEETTGRLLTARGVGIRAKVSSRVRMRALSLIL